MYGIPFRWIALYSSVIIISLVSKLTGYFRDALITSKFGANAITDAYVVALLIPEILFNLFGNSLTSNFAPVYFEAQKRGQHRNFTSCLLTLYLLLASVIFFIGYANTEPLIKIFSSGFHGSSLKMTSSILSVFLINIFCISLTYFLLAYLQANNKFIITSFIGVSYNIAIIIFLFLLKPSLNILITATIIGYIAQFLVQLPQAIKLHIPMPTLKIKFTPEIRKYLLLSLPIAVLAILGQLNIAMDNFFASRLREGSITTLNLGYRMLMGIYSLFITNTMMIIYPKLSKSIVEQNQYTTAAIIQKTANLLLMLLIPIVVYLEVNANFLTALMFQRGAFSTEKCLLTADVFRGYIIGIIFFAFRDLVLRYFFARNSVVIPMLNGIANSLLNYLYLIFLVPILGLPGISLATSVSAVSSFFILFYLVRRKSPAFQTLKFVPLSLKIICSSILSIAVAEWVAPLAFNSLNICFNSTQLISQIVEFIIFAFVYLSILIFILFFGKTY